MGSDRPPSPPHPAQGMFLPDFPRSEALDGLSPAGSTANSQAQKKTSHDGRTFKSQEAIAGRNHGPRARDERGAAKRADESARSRRPLRKRRVQIRQGTPGLRFGAARPVEKAPGRYRHAEPE